MGSYISVLCMNYNKPVYNENQYANLFTFDRKVCIYLVAIKLNDLRLNEGICNMRLFHDQQYVW